MPKKSKEEVRRNMQAIRSKNTKIEIILGKSLWNKGYRYRKNDKSVFGKPDFTFKKYKIAIFCDSEFWHGKDWHLLKQRLTTNPDFWIHKIERNIERDNRVNKQLKSEGWTVIRLWDTEIKKQLEYCLQIIENAINSNSLEQVPYSNPKTLQ